MTELAGFLMLLAVAFGGMAVGLIITCVVWNILKNGRIWL